MSEQETPEQPVQRAARPPARVSVQRRLMVRAGRWAAELSTVFVGVYAAFLFNNYQLHQQQRERREQILAWVEQTYAEGAADIKQQHAIQQKTFDDFKAQLQAGKMPPLHAVSWETDYDPTDTASLLANGGFDLLEVQTVHDIKDAESLLRVLVGAMRRDQELSDNYVLPNLEKEQSFFYDPATKQLRPGYQWYDGRFGDIVQDFGLLQVQLEKLLVQIRAERQRNR